MNKFAAGGKRALFLTICANPKILWLFENEGEKMSKEKNERPNILLIMTDQQRSDSLGCYGFKGIETPNLDRLAQEGVLFENCYVNNPLCTPSRASIFTGKHLPGHGVYRLNDILPEDETMFTKRLADSGYQTALVGKLHISAAVYELSNRNKNDGFDTYDWCHEPALFVDGKYNSYGKWLKENRPDFYEQLRAHGRNVKNVPAECHATRWTAQRTAELIKNRDRDKPFCYVMSIFDPHNPYTDYPAEMEQRLITEHIGKPEFVPGEAHEKPEGVVREHENCYMGSFHDYTPEDIQKMREGYYASIAFIDDEIGRVLGVLEEEGLKDDTIVVFVSDHGDMLGDHEMLAKGAFFYEACTKVPLIIRCPNVIDAGEKASAIVQPHDLACTLLKAAGISDEMLKTEMPDSMDLIEAVKSPESFERNHALCIYRGSGISSTMVYFDPPVNATMLRTGRYKINAYHDFAGGRSLTQGELYDIAADPGEKNNLWNDPSCAELKADLLFKMMDLLVQLDDRQNSSRGGSAKTVSATLLGK